MGSLKADFDAQDYMETGTPGRKGTPEGWLSRYARTSARTGDDTFRSVALTGAFANRVREFADSLHAFSVDLGDRMKNIVVLTLTEFGRTAKQNGTNGTDHGHGSVSFVLGGEVKGGKVYGKWPGLSAGRLYQKRDLAVTTDFRDIAGEILAEHLGSPGIDRIFPDYRPKKVGLL